MAAQDNYKPGDLCLECQQLGVKNVLRYFYINLTTKIIKCESDVCLFPHTDDDSDLDDLEFPQNDFAEPTKCENDDNWLDEMLNENDEHKNYNLNNVDLSFLQDETLVPPPHMPVIIDGEAQTNEDVVFTIDYLQNENFETNDAPTLVDEKIKEESQSSTADTALSLLNDLKDIEITVVAPPPNTSSHILPQIDAPTDNSEKEEEKLKIASDTDMEKTEIASYFSMLKQQPTPTAKPPNNTKNKKTIKVKVEDGKCRRKSSSISIGDTSVKAVMQLLRNKIHK